MHDVFFAVTGHVGVKRLSAFLADVFCAAFALRRTANSEGFVVFFRFASRKEQGKLGRHVAGNFAVAKCKALVAGFVVQLSSAEKHDCLQLLVGRLIDHSRPQKLRFGSNTAVVTFALGKN